MKLPIYEGKKVVKTYEADGYDLLFGTMEDILDAVQIDKIKNGTKEEMLTAVFRLVTTSLDTVRDLLKDIFEGITDEELKHVKVQDIANVLVDVITYTITNMLNKLPGKN